MLKRKLLEGVRREKQMRADMDKKLSAARGHPLPSPPPHAQRSPLRMRRDPPLCMRSPPRTAPRAHTRHHTPRTLVPRPARRCKSARPSPSANRRTCIAPGGKVPHTHGS